MRVLHPHAVTTVRFEGKPMDDKTVFGVRTYMNLYLIIFGAVHHGGGHQPV